MVIFEFSHCVLPHRRTIRGLQLWWFHSGYYICLTRRRSWVPVPEETTYPVPPVEADLLCPQCGINKAQIVVIMIVIITITKYDPHQVHRTPGVYDGRVFSGGLICSCLQNLGHRLNHIPTMSAKRVNGSDSSNPGRVYWLYVVQNTNVV